MKKGIKVIIVVVLLILVATVFVTFMYFWLHKKNITKSQAMDIVLEDVSLKIKDTDVISINYEKDDNEYEIEFSSNKVKKKFEYTINARNGNIIEKEEEIIFFNASTLNNQVPNTQTQSNQATNNQIRNITVSIDKAKEIALLKAGFTIDEVEFIKAEFDTEDNQYEIEFNATDKADSIEYKYEYKISVSNGSIISEHKDSGLM